MFSWMEWGKTWLKGLLLSLIKFKIFISFDVAVLFLLLCCVFVCVLLSIIFRFKLKLPAFGSLSCCGSEKIWVGFNFMKLRKPTQKSIQHSFFSKSKFFSQKNFSKILHIAQPIILFNCVQFFHATQILPLRIWGWWNRVHVCYQFL